MLTIMVRLLTHSVSHGTQQKQSFQSAGIVLLGPHLLLTGKLAAEVPEGFTMLLLLLLLLLSLFWVVPKTYDTFVLKYAGYGAPEARVPGLPAVAPGCGGL